jgi:hypothetical protein
VKLLAGALQTKYPYSRCEISREKKVATDVNYWLSGQHNRLLSFLDEVLQGSSSNLSFRSRFTRREQSLKKHGSQRWNKNIAR